MRTSRALLILIGLVSAAQCAAPDAALDPLVGSWSGTMSSPAGELEIRVDLALDNGEWGAQMFSVTQGNAQIPVESVTVEGAAISLALPAIGGSYEGLLSDDGQRIEGTFAQMGTELALALERMSDEEADEAAAGRPQDPTEPYPYLAEDVSYPNPDGGHTLAGTFTRPEEGGPFPAVILMHGCGGLDWGVERGMARHTAHLVDAGFVTLVVDSFTPRGIDTICSSTRDMAAAYAYRQYDAVAAMRWLREQPNVDPDSIFLMGQSHGGSVAAKLAGRPLQTAEKRDLLERNGDAPWFRALVAYYPWCPHVPRRLDTPLLVLSGEADDWTPPIDCVWHKAVVKGAPYEVVVYEDAHHSFDLPISLQSYIGYTVGGNPKAAADSRRRMVEWFREHME